MSSAGLSAITEKIRKKIPEPVLRYAIPLVSLAIVTGITVLCFRTLGGPAAAPRHPVLYGSLALTFLIILLGAPWLGYGPGLLVCVLIIIVLPRAIGTSNRSLGNDAVRSLMTGVICVLISRLGQTSRRREAELRHAAAELEIRVRERTEEAVRAANAAREALVSVQEQAELLDLTYDAILSLDLDYTIRFWNKGAERMYGYTREEAKGQKSYELLKTTYPESRADMESRLFSVGRWEGEMAHERRDGTRLKIASRWAVRHDAAGTPVGFLELAIDVTERRRIEEQLQHTQKLESLGILAGGVAHDFNNLLTGILGNASLVLEDFPAHNPDRHLLEEVVKAAQRAADLTRQLLAYAGKGRFVMKTVDISALVREISGLLQTSIPKHVHLRLQLAENLKGVDADPGQLQQIVMNLVINGAEAIAKEGGSVLVRTGLQAVDESYIETMSAAGNLLRPGEYISLEVHDTGSGMSDETISKIFDPFFSTKFAGRGLGLSAVLGIVRAHKGALKVYSTLGNGTTFKILFPVSSHPLTSQNASMAGSLTGSGTVLIADDEETVRETARNTLERYGYSAVTVEDGAKAVEQYRRQRDAIKLVLLDLTMPVMNGEQALREMQQINPRVRVLLSSGYNEVEAIQRFAGKGLAGFIQKPYTSAALAEKVKEVLTR